MHYDPFAEDESNDLARTQGGGISAYDRQNARFALYRHNPGQADSLRTNIVTAVYEDPTGTLWIGTDDGLDSLDRRRGQYTHYPSDPPHVTGLSSKFIRAIYRDSSDVLWVGTEGGGLSRLEQRYAVPSLIRA